MAYTKNGNVYSFGDNTYGQLALGHFTSKSTPQLVEFLKCGDIIQLRVGAKHGIASVLL